MRVLEPWQCSLMVGHCAHSSIVNIASDPPGPLEQVHDRRARSGMTTGLLLLGWLGAEGQLETTGLQQSDDKEHGYGYIEPCPRSPLRIPFLLGAGFGQWLVATPAFVATFGVVGAAIWAVHVVCSPLGAG